MTAQSQLNHILIWQSHFRETPVASLRCCANIPQVIAYTIAPYIPIKQPWRQLELSFFITRSNIIKILQALQGQKHKSEYYSLDVTYSIFAHRSKAWESHLRTIELITRALMFWCGADYCHQSHFDFKFYSNLWYSLPRFINTKK